MITANDFAALAGPSSPPLVTSPTGFLIFRLAATRAGGEVNLESGQRMMVVQQSASSSRRLVRELALAQYFCRPSYGRRATGAGGRGVSVMRAAFSGLDLSSLAQYPPDVIWAASADFIAVTVTNVGYRVGCATRAGTQRHLQGNSTSFIKWLLGLAVLPLTIMRQHGRHRADITLVAAGIYCQ